MSSSSGSGSGQNDVFDVRKVRRFIELMNEHDLSEIDLRQGDQRIRLRRGPESVTVATSPAMPTAGATFSTPGGSAPAAPQEAAPAADESNEVFIKSPMVGTFYAASSPDAAPFVKVGDQVGPETTVCIIEAMKVFNEIPAECSGKVTAVLAQSGDAVDFGRPLFRVAPNV